MPATAQRMSQKAAAPSLLEHQPEQTAPPDARAAKRSPTYRTTSRCFARGYRVAVDDLGTGRTWLMSFALLQPDIVKVDAMLTRNADTNVMKQRLGHREAPRERGHQSHGTGAV